MLYRILADILVLIHLLFIVFVILGALLVLRWGWIAWLHIPCALWGALIEFAGWICPLTPLENRLRVKSGTSGYESGFIEHYLLPVIYPDGLTPTIQILLGSIVLIVNTLAYGWIWLRRTRSTQ